MISLAQRMGRAQGWASSLGRESLREKLTGKGAPKCADDHRYA